MAGVPLCVVSGNSFISSGVLAGAILLSCTGNAAVASEAPPCFGVPPLAQWQQAKRTHVVLEGVTVPGDQSLKIRVTARARGDRETVLGVVAVHSPSPPVKENRRLPSLRVDVTRGLKQLMSTEPLAHTLTFCLHAVDPRNAPLPNAVLAAESLRLETRME